MTNAGIRQIEKAVPGLRCAVADPRRSKGSPLRMKRGSDEGRMSPRQSDETSAARREPWRMKYTVRSLLLVTTLVALCCSRIACIRTEYVEQLSFAKEIRDRGGMVTIMPGCHPWLNYFSGREISRGVVQVRLTNECVCPEIMARMLLLSLATFEADSDKLSDDDLKWISDANDLKQLENNKSPI